MSKQNNTKEILSITLKLLVICSIVATIVASVNAITKERILHNEKQNTADALTDIYKDDYSNSFSVSGDSFIIEENGNAVITCSQANTEFSSKDVKALYVLKNAESEVLGYCISVHPMGFKDYIKMLVAITPENKVKDVKIVSMSETSGIGTKALEPSFLEQFRDKDNTNGVDTISGATKTSKPVIDGVNAALSEVASYIDKVGGED